MVLILLLAAILVAGVVVAIAVGRVPAGMEPAPLNRADNRLPDGPLRPADLTDLAFTVALRGYRMDEVDAVLDRLTGELEDLHARLAQARLTQARATGPEEGSAPVDSADPGDTPQTVALTKGGLPPAETVGRPETGSPSVPEDPEPAG